MPLTTRANWRDICTIKARSLSDEPLQTQGKIERGHQTLKNRNLLKYDFFEGEFTAPLAAFIEQDNNTAV